MLDRLAFAVFLVGLTICGILGFGTSMTFGWPACLLLGLSAVLAARGLLRAEKNRRPSSLCLGFGVAVSAFVVLRGNLSPVAYLAREDMALAGTGFLIWGLVAMAFPESRYRAGVVVVLALLALVNIGFAFWQSACDGAAWVLPGYSRTYLDRAGGVFNNPNHLAGFLAAVAPVFLALTIWGRAGPHRRIVLGFLGILCLLTLALTRSRGGILAAGTSLAVLTVGAAWLHRAAWRSRPHLVLTAAALGALVVGGIAAANFQNLKHRFSGDAFSASAEANRPLLWQTALRQHAESPIFGTGSRSYFYYSRKLRSPEMHVSVMEADFAHNEYLQALAEYGWAGIALLGCFLIAHAGNGLRLVRRYERAFREGTRRSLLSRHLALTIGSLAGLAALGVHASVDFLLHVPAVAMVAALLLGILANPGPLPHRKSGVATALISPRLCRATIPLTGVALLIFGMTFVRSEWHFEKATRSYAAGETDLGIFGRLHRARALDPANPFAHSLSGHIHLGAIDASMPEPVRAAYLRKAKSHFETALVHFPQDIYAMLGLAGCLDALGSRPEAAAVLARARSWAPLYGNIMHAQGELAFRAGDLDRAERFFTEARDAAAFRDWRAARRALDRVDSARRHGQPAGTETVAEK